MNEEFKSAQAIVKAVKAKRVRAVEVCAHFIESIKTIIIPPSIFDGVVIALVGTIWLFGYHANKREDESAEAYLIVGTIIALIFSILFISIMLANGVEFFVLHNEDFADWNLLSDLRWLLILSVYPLFFVVKFRRKFFNKKLQNEASLANRQQKIFNNNCEDCGNCINKK